MKGRILAAIGIVLVCAAAMLTVWEFTSSRRSADAAADIADRLCALMPETSVGAADERENTAMPQAELEGESFIGVIEAPLYGCKLPIYNKWDAKRVSDYPCRFTGSVYAEDLVVGGSDAVGQLDFMENITVGDSVTVTDMTGARFEYTVTEIEMSETADAEKLESDASLTIFARDTYSLEYIIVRCE